MIVVDLWYILACCLVVVAGFAELSVLALSTKNWAFPRREFLGSATAFLIAPSVVAESNTILEVSNVTIPLEFTGQELLIAYTVEGSVFKAVLDTGSPFLMIPGSCGANTRQKSGCFQNQGRPVLPPTTEIFDGFEGEVNWRKGGFGFWDIGTQQEITRESDQQEVIFGVASEEIMGGPGGVFFGMIRDTDARIRPSFLGQTNVRAFAVDLRAMSLTLSNRPLVVGEDSIPMTNRLRKQYGDPVGHYTAVADSMLVNGYPLAKNVLVIFDTGVTGMVVSRGLFDEEYMRARQQKEKRLFGNVDLTFTTTLGKTVRLSAQKPLSTPFDPERTWKKFPRKGQAIVVMGLAFLKDRSLTVDIDEARLWVA